VDRLVLGAAGKAPRRAGALAETMQMENRDRKNLRQDEQDLQDELSLKSSFHQTGSLYFFSLLFHPVNPVHPVKFPCFNCIVPAWTAPIPYRHT
jgi:hypothetical protein